MDNSTQESISHEKREDLEDMLESLLLVKILLLVEFLLLVESFLEEYLEIVLLYN